MMPKKSETENPNNIRWVCDDHAPKPGKYKRRNPKKFLGTFVKKAFPTKDGSIEHMWVEVTELEGVGLKGTLANIPDLPMDLKMGDAVHVKMSEIEEVLERKELMN